MMFGVPGGEEVGGGFVVGLGLAAAPVPEEAVAEAAEPADDPHRLGQGHAAWIVAVRAVQALVQAAFDAPGGPVALPPLGGVQRCGRQARHPRDGFRGVWAQVAAPPGDLLDAGKVHRLGAAGAGTQDARFRLALIELTFARQRGRGRPRGKNPPAGRE